MALLWSAGIVWTAVDVAGGSPQADVDGNSVEQSGASGVTGDSAQAQQVERLLEKMGK